MIGIVADDLTGSNDIGIMFAKNGYLTYIYPYDQVDDIVRAPERNLPLPDILILNTDSRLDPPGVAYDKVWNATRHLMKIGCQQFYKKTCSVFRGNIGPEMDAMLDALGREFGVVVLGFPKNGRTTIDGTHYVHGKLLEESEFRNDPVHPAFKSNLVEILQGQTKRKVGLIKHGEIRLGQAQLEQRLQLARVDHNYVIFDVADQEMLHFIAGVVSEEKVFGGSSALAEELAMVWGKKRLSNLPLKVPNGSQSGIFFVSGSLMPQTAAQIEYLRKIGVSSYELITTDIFNPEKRQDMIQYLVKEISLKLGNHHDVLLFASNHPEEVRKTVRLGMEAGMPKIEISRLVSRMIAEIATGTVTNSGTDRLVVAGGETSAAVCNMLQIKGLMVWQEIEPGLPSCMSLADPPMLLILKSGSFGGAGFFEKARQYMKSYMPDRSDDSDCH